MIKPWKWSRIKLLNGATHFIHMKEVTGSLWLRGYLRKCFCVRGRVDMKYLIEIELSGYASLTVDDETGKDNYGNDQEDLLAAIKAGDGQDIDFLLDWLTSDTDNDVDVTVRDEDGRIVLSW